MLAAEAVSNLGSMLSRLAIPLGQARTLVGAVGGGALATAWGRAGR